MESINSLFHVTYIVRTDMYCVVLCWFGLDNAMILMVSKKCLAKK